MARTQNAVIRNTSEFSKASGEKPPPGTMICAWGWVRADPQLCSTAVSPMRAPRCLGSAAMVIRVSADAQVCAGLAAFDMTAQRRCSAALNRRHDLELAEAHMAGMRRTPRRPAAAEDVRHLDRWP